MEVNIGVSTRNNGVDIYLNNEILFNIYSSYFIYYINNKQKNYNFPVHVSRKYGTYNDFIDNITFQLNKGIQRDNLFVEYPLKSITEIKQYIIKLKLEEIL